MLPMLSNLIGLPCSLVLLNPNQVKELQQALKDLGYEVGDVDGLVGKKTAAAWAEFKTDHWLGNLGEIGTSSIATLRKALEARPKSIYATVSTINWDDLDQPVSKYFTLKETIITGQTGDNRPKLKYVAENILRLASHLDKIREDWGNPIGVSSWYRSPEINAKVGGVSNSQHLTGSAADIYPIGGNIWRFQEWLDNRWPYALGYGAKRGFVHVDLRPGRIRWNY